MAKTEWKARPHSFDTDYGHTAILIAVKDALFDRRYGFMRPVEIARQIGCTRAEAVLALFYWRELKYLARRDRDGRWYYDNDEPWRAQ